MTAIILQLASLSAKIALLAGLAWGQLYLLRRAPAASRSRLCSVALVGILLLASGEMLAPRWTVTTPVYTLYAAAPLQGLLPGGARVPWSSWTASLWMVGAAFMLLRAVAGRASLALLRRRSTLLERASGLEVRIAPVQTAILSGWLRPTILLPETARAWTGEQRRMVLAHELTHVRQGDVWTNLLAQMVRAVFWFHPVIWLLVSRLSREQELSCDEAVVAAGYSRHDYAAFLLEAVRGLKSREMFACAMAGSGARSLKQRFANLLDPKPRQRSTRRMALFLASFALVAAALTVVRPLWSQDQDKVYQVGNGVTAPKLLYKVEPEYTPEAKDDHIEGTVLLKIIVTAEGGADRIQIVRSLEPGLDQKAIEALSKWVFQPGTKDGQAVAVWAAIEVNFRLK